MLRPIVEYRGVEVGAVGPDECPYLGIHLDPGEQPHVAQWPVELAFQDALEVDLPGAAVVKADSEPIAAKDLY